MTAALDAIRARDAASDTDDCEYCHEYAPAPAEADRRYLLAALDRAEVVVAAARAYTDLTEHQPWNTTEAFDGREALRAALRAYEDADKVADG